jgi:hypothetical protein
MPRAEPAAVLRRILAVARNQSANIAVLVAVAPLPFVRNIRVHQAVIVGLSDWSAGSI